MNLDLDELLVGWNASADEVCARLVECDSGESMVQLRVDLGLLQMAIDGRPDGERFHGLPSVREFFEHEAAVGHELESDDWRELHRELQQYNYRRLALSNLAEVSMRDQHGDEAGEYLKRTLRDIDHCLAILQILRANPEHWDGPLATLVPTLIFNRARLMTRLRSVEQRYDEAIEEAEAGIRQLEELMVIAEVCEEEPPHENPAVSYLRQMAQRLREQHGINLTLQEQLDAAIEQEDFEAAARLRDELRRRQSSDRPVNSTPPGDE